MTLPDISWPSSSITRWIWFIPVICVAVGCSSNTSEIRPFFQTEYRVEAHGRKTLFDHIVELDPGAFNVEVAADYLKHPPARIAILPFADVGNANFVVDKIPLTFRSEEERRNWAWTDAQRLRRALDGYLSQREFLLVNLKGIDAVLRARGINTPQRLSRLSPAELGKWFGVDAVVYGTVKNYEAYYFGLIAAWRVRVDVKMVSTHTGENLIEATGSRYDTNLLVALTLEDIAISSRKICSNFAISIWHVLKRRRVVRSFIVYRSLLN